MRFGKKNWKRRGESNPREPALAPRLTRTKDPPAGATGGHSMTGKVVTGQEVDWSRYDDCMRISVVGESHYQDALKRVSKCPPSGDHRYECSAVLVLEPDNPYDKFAVMVQVDGELVGYLPRGTAKRFGKRLRGMAERGEPAICMAFIGRSADAGHSNLGISLRLPYDGDILQGKT